jgi:hypothetical protein
LVSWKKVLEVPNIYTLIVLYLKEKRPAGGGPLREAAEVAADI